MHSFNILPLLLALASAAPAAIDTSTKGLHDYAKAAGLRYFGTAPDIPQSAERSDVAYMAQLNNTHDFGQLTPGRAMKPYYTEPERGVFDFKDGDVVADIAEANGQLLRCHTLVWGNSLPGWLTEKKWDKDTLTSIMTKHITNLVSHYGTRCHAWDVVNEAFNDDGSYRSNIWYEAIGPDYIAIAFKAAASAAPASVKLYYNEYSTYSPGPKTSAVQKIISTLKSKNIRIDGVGLQYHMTIGETPSQKVQEDNIAAFGALGVEVALTEVDVRTPKGQTKLVTPEQKEQQKKDYQAISAACVKSKACIGITLWDFLDDYSWLPGTYACPWYRKEGEDKLTRKTAYDGIVDGLKA